MPAPVSVMALIEAYRPAHAKCGEVRSQLAALDASGVVAQEESLRDALLAAMQPNWPYRFDESQSLVKRRKGWFGWELAILPIKVETSDGYEPPAVETRKAVPRVVQLAAAAAISVAVGAYAPRGCDIPWPIPTPAPDVATSEFEAAGYSLARTGIIPAFADAFAGSADKIAVAGTPMAVVKEDHVARLRAGVAAADAAVAQAFAKVVPEGADPTPEQRAALSAAYREFAAGMRRAVK